MVRARRRAAPLLLLGALTAASFFAGGHAAAGDPAPPLAAKPSSADAAMLPLRARPSWGAIPRASIPGLPSHDAAPAALAATEQVSGFSIENNGAAGSPRLRVFVETTPARRSCLSADVDFSTEADPTLHSGTTVAHMRLGVVTAMRAERLVIEGGSAALEITDLWIDPRSRGMRVIESTRLALGVLAKAPREATVYGYRDTSDRLWAVLAAGANASAIDSEGQLVSAACGHVRLSAGESGAQVALPWDAASSMENRNPQRVEMPRELLVTVAASRTSRDREPVVSVVIALSTPRIVTEAID